MGIMKNCFVVILSLVGFVSIVRGRRNALERQFLAPNANGNDCYEYNTGAQCCTLDNGIHENVASPIECQRICQITELCENFVYWENKNKCILKSGDAQPQERAPRKNTIFGPKFCPGALVKGDIVLFSSSESTVKKSFEKFGGEWIWGDPMRMMLGKMFTVLDVNVTANLIGLPSPVPSANQSDIWHFARSVVEKVTELPPSCFNGGTMEFYSTTNGGECVNYGTCLNGGTANCINGGACSNDEAWKCLCQPGFGGALCEFELPPSCFNGGTTSSGTCLNGGSCLNGGTEDCLNAPNPLEACSNGGSDGMGTCFCQPGFGGASCEFET